MQSEASPDSLVSATAAMDDSIGDLARDINRVHDQLEKGDFVANPDRFSRLVRRITENTLKTRKWQLELKQLAAESEHEVDTTSCPDLAVREATNSQCVRQMSRHISQVRFLSPENRWHIARQRPFSGPN